MEQRSSGGDEDGQDAESLKPASTTSTLVEDFYCWENFGKHCMLFFFLHITICGELHTFYSQHEPTSKTLLLFKGTRV